MIRKLSPADIMAALDHQDWIEDRLAEFEPGAVVLDTIPGLILKPPANAPDGYVDRGPRCYFLPTNTPQGLALWEKQYAEMAAQQVVIGVEPVQSKPVDPARTPEQVMDEAAKKAANVARTQKAREMLAAKLAAKVLGESPKVIRIER